MPLHIQRLSRETKQVVAVIADEVALSQFAHQTGDGDASGADRTADLGMGQTPGEAVAALARFTELFDQQGQETQEAIDGAALAEGTEPEEFALMLVAEGIQDFAAEVGPVVQVMPVEPDDRGLVNMGKTLETEGRLRHNFKGLTCADKSQEGFFRVYAGGAGAVCRGGDLSFTD